MAEAQQQEDQPDKLETLLNQATNPLSSEEDALDSITRFCDIVNMDPDGPHDALQLLTHKITSPQEKEALFGLTVLEVCVKNCGHKFHTEIGKFRFLNEMIKVISPKYLGSKRSEKVKKKCVELMYCWTKALPHVPKIGEAYTMLKKQGIVKEDPTYMDKACDLLPVPRPRPKKAVFEDEDKSKLLARLLKSKHPEDLQAANRLIKNMVKQDAEKNEKVSRRVRELDTVSNNSKLLVEMLDQYNPSTTTSSECDVMRELYDALEKHRPVLFRLASDTDEKDTNAMNQILEANDALMKVVDKYKSIFGESPKHEKADKVENKDASSLLDLGPASNPPSGTDTGGSSSLLQTELASLGLDDLILGDPPTQNGNANVAGDNSFTDFNDLFSNPPASSGFPTQPVSITGFETPPAFHIPPAPAPVRTTDSTAAPANPTPAKSSALADLDFLGEFQQNLPGSDKQLPFIPSSELNKKPSLNQMKQSSQNAQQQLAPGLEQLDPQLTGLPLIPTQPVSLLDEPVTKSPAAAAVSTENTSGRNSSPTVRLNPTIPGPTTAEQLSLTDIFVELQSIKPDNVPSITIYDKNSVKIVIHFGKDSPKPHILVMVVSTMSTNPSPVKNFLFQAAVPKMMRVKLQPPSTTELPGFNPILPPTAITQVLLLANPQKDQIRLKFKVTYTINDQSYADSGEYDKFPVQ